MHRENDWIGIQTTGKRIAQRNMDFWRREDDFDDQKSLLREPIAAVVCASSTNYESSQMNMTCTASSNTFIAKGNPMNTYFLSTITKPAILSRPICFLAVEPHMFHFCAISRLRTH